MILILIKFLKLFWSNRDLTYYLNLIIVLIAKKKKIIWNCKIKIWFSLFNCDWLLMFAIYWNLIKMILVMSMNLRISMNFSSNYAEKKEIRFRISEVDQKFFKDIIQPRVSGCVLINAISLIIDGPSTYNVRT